MTDIPHFDLPLRYQGGKPVVVEQGGIDDVKNCVEAALRTHEGERKELPDFGIADITFQQQPISTVDLMAQIAKHEPRVILAMEQSPGKFDSLILNLIVDIATSEVT